MQGVKDERSFDHDKAREQAETLYNAGEGKLGTDESAFVEILAHAGQRQSFLIFEEYKKISGKTIEQALRSEMSGELLNGLLAIGITRLLISSVYPSTTVAYVTNDSENRA